MITYKQPCGCLLNTVVIALGNENGDPSSNPGWGICISICMNINRKHMNLLSPQLELNSWVNWVL